MQLSAASEIGVLVIGADLEMPGDLGVPWPGLRAVSCSAGVADCAACLEF